jgi:hypothetical protein
MPILDDSAYEKPLWILSCNNINSWAGIFPRIFDWVQNFSLRLNLRIMNGYAVNSKTVRPSVVISDLWRNSNRFRLSVRWRFCWLIRYFWSVSNRLLFHSDEKIHIRRFWFVSMRFPSNIQSIILDCEGGQISRQWVQKSHESRARTCRFHVTSPIRTFSERDVYSLFHILERDYTLDKGSRLPIGRWRPVKSGIHRIKRSLRVIGNRLWKTQNQEVILKVQKGNCLIKQYSDHYQKVMKWEGR